MNYINLSPKIASIIIFILSLHSTAAISDNDTKILVEGRVMDNQTRDAIEYATVALFSSNDDLLDGTITDADGSFRLETYQPGFYLKIEFMGYETLFVKDYDIVDNKVSLPEILMSVSEQQLDEVVVRAEKSQMEFKLDKRVFNVGEDLSSAGGSALDVLNNVPSVDVSIEGTVHLRGNANVQMLINGKPSVLTERNSLGTITAEMIDKIEVVTNPSAKYDAEGTSGIINIIMKKSEKKGVNGALTINTGYPANHSLGLSLNRRSEKFNLFSQFGVGKRTYTSAFEGLTIDKSADPQTYLQNEGSGNKHEQFYNLILGTDYHINQWNVLTFSGHLAYEIEDEDSEIFYMGSEDFLPDGEKREEITEAINPKYEFELSYKRSFEDNEDKSLTGAATGSYFGKDKSTLFVNEIDDIERGSQQFENDYVEAVYAFQTDYENPFSTASTIETGAKYEIMKLSNDYSMQYKEGGVWTSDPVYNDVFIYHQHIGAAYLSYGYEPGKIGGKIGARIENTYVNVSSESTGNETKKNYLDIFPSAHLSYKFTEQLSFMLGYSRRIQRADWDELIPVSFHSFKDSYNLFYGNPDLDPEYTNAFELSAIQIWNKVSLNGSVFFRNTNKVITEVIRVKDNVSYTTVENIGSRDDLGFEINGKAEPAKWVAIMLDAYFSAFKRKGGYRDLTFDYSSSNWSGRITIKFKLPMDFDIEILTRYRSSVEDVQITYSAMAYADFGIRKKFLKGRGVLNLSIRDIFSSRTRIGEADSPSFYRYSKYQHDGRRIVFGFSYGFGKGEAMHFSGQKMF